MITFHRVTYIALATCLLPLIAGCGSGGAHPESEHHVPAHKPADFPAAVRRLQELHAEILAGARHRAADEINAYDEMADIVKWLPELAADSDVPKEPWDQICSLAARLQSSLELASQFRRSAKES
jgi:hypothetical protein